MFRKIKIAMIVIGFFFLGYSLGGLIRPKKISPELSMVHALPKPPPRLTTSEAKSDGYPLLWIVNDSKTGREFLVVDIGGKPAVCPMQ
jgi:hypothetical protein